MLVLGGYADGWQPFKKLPAIKEDMKRYLIALKPISVR